VSTARAAKRFNESVTSVELVLALRNARDVIDRRFAEPLDLTALAAASGYSLHYFARSFRTAFGETPRGYLTRRRIERAQDLLRAANLTVTEICMLVGFSSLGSFSSRFTEVVGCSPQEYRKRSRSANTPAIPGCFVMQWMRATADPGRD
jgi:AraC-like DNA-binding protein